VQAGDYLEYEYYAVGNRTKLTTCIDCWTETVTNYTYDNANRLTYVDETEYTWDANGNLLHDGLDSYAYDQANRLISVVNMPPGVYFTYNGLGDRVQQTVAGQTTSYALDLARMLTQVLADDDGNTYLYGVGRIGEEGHDGWQYHHGDALGSVRQVTDISGEVTLAKTYKPYGDVLNSAGSNSTSYGFTGERTDTTGMVYLRERYYEPGAGRFISRDTWGGDYLKPMSINKWLYVLSNPINYTDPTGHGYCDSPYAFPDDCDW
jgi:RHS repeat-associated protein